MFLFPTAVYILHLCLAIAAKQATLVAIASSSSGIEGGDNLVATVEGWTVQVRSTWDVLGPFPQQAREQHSRSPSYPVDLSKGWKPDYSRQYPSSLADGGLVRWTQMQSVNGNLAVMFPEIRWQQLRSTEGWAALQHHALLHTTLTVTPPQNFTGHAREVPTFIADVQSASYFTLIPDDLPADYTPKWQTGNIYNFPKSPAQIIPLPVLPASNKSTAFHLVASGDYEIRLFGDPLENEGQTTPIQRLKFGFKFDNLPNESPFVLDSSLDVYPDFVGGWALASEGAIGIGVRAEKGWWKISRITSNNTGFKFKLNSKLFRLAPHQTRILPLQLQQSGQYLGQNVTLQIDFKKVKEPTEDVTSARTYTLEVTVPIVHKDAWSHSSDINYKATYFFNGNPAYFMVKPPLNSNVYSPAIIALHGAGVEADNTFWTAAVPRQNSSWVVFPTGGTGWGYDWHGSSSIDVWGSFDAFRSLLKSRQDWEASSIEEHRVVMIGHSNGGQGVWYQIERFPDRIIAAVPASAYIKSQLYPSTTLSHGAHFLDASLGGILESALQPDRNDLYLSNLVSTPILAIHGSEDRNVPTWHTRQLYATLKEWYHDSNITYLEVPDKPHWWNEVFKEQSVQHFLDMAVSSVNTTRIRPSSFVLSAMSPEDMRGLHGFRIRQLERPGRLAKLQVDNASASKIRVRALNVWEFSVDISLYPNAKSISVDGTKIGIRAKGSIIWLSQLGGEWHEEPIRGLYRPSGPLNRILFSSEQLIIVIPKDSSFGYLSACLRIAHDLLSYLRIDTQILSDEDALKHLGKRRLGCSNIVILGGQENVFGQQLMSGNPGAVVFTKRGWKLRSRTFNDAGQGIAFLHSHPTCPTGLTLFLSAIDEAGLERILRLFPLRTGVPVPEWTIVGSDTDLRGAGGLLGAGWWGRYWEWNEAHSWLGID